MYIVRVCLNKEKKGFITCRQCGMTRIIDVSTHDNASEKPVMAKCNCGSIYKIIFERKFHRMRTSIPGTLSPLNAHDSVHHVLITSLSVGDVGFLMIHTKMKINEECLLEFALDDGSRAQITEEIIIRRVNGGDVGAEFRDNWRYHHALDFYTLPLIPLK